MILSTLSGTELGNLALCDVKYRKINTFVAILLSRVRGFRHVSGGVLLSFILQNETLKIRMNVLGTRSGDACGRGGLLRGG